uniref:Proteic killer suppression protein n=1 Tax=Candidatus Kentrum sp. MB TaxID=2138164 RepID=A0A450XIK1_9GAMM|nr:MAG: proteic killer suppression protein [Candidatus Kentron sp. MB]VFK29132.1 MAG: proteic killer suppression protein [Candidatus Kentron sp. MB]VFK74683.1 MAG: proteic killer suppression protein [Candidatus Kentron sp. MB]
MIKTFTSKELAELFTSGDNHRIRDEFKVPCLRRLDILEQAQSLTDIDMPGFHLHALSGGSGRYGLQVHGPWYMTFDWEEGKVFRVNLKQYH